jgi:Na+-driven multidrug efflux pump
VTAAIIAAAGGHLRTIALAAAIVVTLIVYWVAEEYAELLGARAEQTQPLSRGYVRAELVATWPMVSASYGPVAALLVARLFGASDAVAADIGLAAAILLLVGHSWSAGRAARLRGRQLIMTTCVAAVFGLVMVVLKHVVLVYLH